MNADAAAIVDSMLSTIKESWYPICRNAGVSPRECELIRSAFIYEGFDYDLNDPSIVTDDLDELPTMRSK